VVVLAIAASFVWLAAVAIAGESIAGYAGDIRPRRRGCILRQYTDVPGKRGAPASTGRPARTVPNYRFGIIRRCCVAVIA